MPTKSQQRNTFPVSDKVFKAVYDSPQSLPGKHKWEEKKGTGYFNLAGRPRGRSVDARPSATGGRLGRGKPDDLVREAGGGRLE